MRELFPELFASLRGYRFEWIKKDLLAGVTLGLIALPLAMAFGIASGVSPEKGLITGIVAGFLISFFSGSRYQIGGPTGAFVVVIYTIVERRGLEGLVGATLLAAFFLIVFAGLRLGSLIRHVPHPLIIGFTSGIALIIFSSQMKDFFGLQMQTPPASFIGKWSAYCAAFPTIDVLSFSMGASTLCLIFLLRRFIPALPWGIGAIVLTTTLASFFSIPVDTIHSRFGTLPALSFPTLPTLPTPSIQLFLDAFTIALLAGIESLLSCAIADGIAGTTHRPNAELLAQGIGNLGSVFFGGIPATGAIARTAANVKIGAKSPLAGMMHAVTLLFLVLFAGPLVGQIPLAALAAVLIMVAWNISEFDRFRLHLQNPTLWTSFFLTVLTDITLAIAIGMLVFKVHRRREKIQRTEPSQN